MYIITNRTIIGNVAMQVEPPGGQTCNQCKWRHLVVQVAPPGDQNWNYYKLHHLLETSNLEPISISWVRCASGNVRL